MEGPSTARLSQWGRPSSEGEGASGEGRNLGFRTGRRRDIRDVAASNQFRKGEARSLSPTSMSSCNDGHELALPRQLWIASNWASSCCRSNRAQAPSRPSPRDQVLIPRIQRRTARRGRHRDVAPLARFWWVKRDREARSLSPPTESSTTSSASARAAAQASGSLASFELPLPSQRHLALTIAISSCPHYSL